MISGNIHSMVMALIGFTLCLSIVWLGLASQVKNIPGVRLITGGTLIGCIGLAILAARNELNTGFWIFAGNFGYVTSIYLIWSGIRRFFGYNVIWPVPILCVSLCMVGTIYFEAVVPMINVRVLLQAIAVSLVCFLSAREIFRGAKRPFALLSQITMAALVINAIAQIIRGAIVSQDLASDRQFFQLTPLEEPTLIIAAFAHVAWNFALITMISARQHVYMHRLAHTDPLTSIANRRSILDQLGKAIDVHNARGTPLSLLLIDLDSLKMINDQYGHDAGDRTLQHVAGKFKENLSGTDVVGRLGGDEFCVVLAGRNAKDARNIAEKIRQSIAASPCMINDSPVALTVSIGSATVTGQKSVADAINKADGQLYAAKQAGRNIVNAPT